MGPRDLTIARLAPAELELLEPLWNALREHHAAVVTGLGSLRPRAGSWRLRRREYETWLDAPGSFALIARRAGRPIGYAMVHVHDGSATWARGERAGELETLSVLPDEQGAGVGSALLLAVRKELARQGVGELSLQVMFTNEDALRFYERQGFRCAALWLTSRIPLEN